MRARKAKPVDDSETPVAPAKFHAGHAPCNISPRAGARKGWQNDAEHPLLLAYAKGQLIRGDERYSSRQRFDAGDEYRRLFELMHRSGRDSTDIDMVSSSTALSITQEMMDAIKRLAAIEAGLKRQDRAIIRHVCGEGWWPSEAVRQACGEHYDKATVPSF